MLMRLGPLIFTKLAGLKLASSVVRETRPDLSLPWQQIFPDCNKNCQLLELQRPFQPILYIFSYLWPRMVCFLKPYGPYGQMFWGSETTEGSVWNSRVHMHRQYQPRLCLDCPVARRDRFMGNQLGKLGQFARESVRLDIFSFTPFAEHGWRISRV